MKKTILTIELVPKSGRYKNLRSVLSKDQWDTSRKQTYKMLNTNVKFVEEKDQNGL